MKTTFNYSGDYNASLQVREEAKRFFIEKLGSFREEFEQKNGLVNINFSVSHTSYKRYSFNLGQDYNLSDFIIRWNQYILASQ